MSVVAKEATRPALEMRSLGSDLRRAAKISPAEARSEASSEASLAWPAARRTEMFYGFIRKV